MALYNPYDYIGENHNDILDEIIAECYKNPTFLSHSEKRQLEQIIIKQTASKLLSIQNQSESIAVKKKIEIMVTNHWNVLVNASEVSLDEYKIEKETKFQLKKLINLDFNNEKTKDKIIDIEQDFLNLDIPENEKVVGLSASSISTHSFEYWNKVKNESVHNKKDDKIKPNNNSTNESKWSHWLSNLENISFSEIIKKDVEGAIKGGLKGLVIDSDKIIYGALVEGVLSSGAKGLTDFGFKFFKN